MQNIYNRRLLRFRDNFLYVIKLFLYGAKMNRLIAFILVLSISEFSFSTPPDYTIDWNLDLSCRDSDAKYCYPFFYMTADQEISFFPNYVSALNVLSPVFTIGSLSICYALLNKFERTTRTSINQKMVVFDRLENQLRELLANVIVLFENGIGNDDDLMLINASVDILNNRNCRSCISKFVEIVSERSLHNSNSANHEKFVEFSKNLHQELLNKKMHECDDNEEPLLEALKITRNQKDFHASGLKKRWSDLWDKHSHPFHLTNSLFALISWSACATLPQFINTDNRAGAYFGDMANIMNAIIIPAIGPLNILQQVLNADREKEKKLHAEIVKKLTKLSGIIEISALVIGKIDNKITIQEARGFIKALLIVEWPYELKELFMQTASSGDIQIKENLKAKLQQLIVKKSLPYYDSDIDEALLKKDNVKEYIIDLEGIEIPEDSTI
jgi:hypothetical protein